jgi:repressor LexA
VSDLTDRQVECFECVVSLIEKNGEPPTIREVADCLDLRSPHPAYRLLHILYERGYVTWESNKPRSLRVLKKVRRKAKPKA